MEAQKKIIEKLDLFNESYKIENDKVIITTDSPLYVYVTFENNKCLIEGKLMRWNFLTGFFRMTLKSSYKYLNIMVIALILLFIANIFLYAWKEITIDLNSAVFGLGIFVLILSWTFLTFLHLEMLYTTKKRQIMDWLD